MPNPIGGAISAIVPWTDAYNLTRPHAGIGGLTPSSRVNNLLGNNGQRGKPAPVETMTKISSGPCRHTPHQSKTLQLPSLRQFTGLKLVDDLAPKGLGQHRQGIVPEVKIVMFALWPCIYAHEPQFRVGPAG